MSDKNDPNKEGHTREWQDRARVVLDAKEAAGTEASPRQSPVNAEEEEKKKVDTERNAESDDDRFY